MCYTCLHAQEFYVPTCLSATVVHVPTCLRANIPKVCKLLIVMCQCANKRANASCTVLMFQIGVLPGQTVCQVFEYSSYEIVGKSSILYYHIKNSTLHLISKLYISKVYVNFISIIHFISKENVSSFSFLLFLIFFAI